jgi:hypothetical protein
MAVYNVFKIGIKSIGFDKIIKMDHVLVLLVVAGGSVVKL